MEKDQDQRQCEEINNQNTHKITQKPVSDSGVREDIVPLNNQNYLEYTMHIQFQKLEESHISQTHSINQLPQSLPSNSANFIQAQIDELSKGQQQCCDSCKEINDKNQKIYTEMQAKIVAAYTTQEQYEAKYKIFLQQKAKLLEMRTNLQYKESLLIDQKHSFQDKTKESVENLKQLMKLIVNCFQKWNQGNSQFRLVQEIDREIQEYVLQKKRLTFFENYLENKINDIDRLYKQQRQSLQRMRATIANSLAQCKKAQQNVQRQYKDQLKKLEKEKEQLTSQISKLVNSQNTNKKTLIKNDQDIISLNRTIESNKMFLNRKQLMFKELQRKIQELQKSKCQSFQAKQQIKLITEQISAQKLKNILQTDLNNKANQLIKAQLEIKKLSSQKQDNYNDYQYYRGRVSDRQQISQELRQKFKIQIKKKLDKIIQIAQKSSRQNRQTINQQFNNLLSYLKEQITKFNTIYDQFWRLEELYYNLSCDLIKKNAQISLKEALLKQSNQRSSQLIKQIKNLDEKLIQITGYYQKQMEQIKKQFQSKLHINAQQIQLYYQKLIQNKQANYKAIIQIVNEELTLSNYINKAKFDQYEKQQQSYKKQIQSLEECIKKSEDTYLKQIKSQEQQISQKDSDLQLLQQKLKKYEGIVLSLNKHIHDLQAQANQKSKFLFETHEKLQNKSLKQLLSQIDEQVPPHSRQLIDFMNCIIYQQSQRQKDVNSLQLNIRKLQRQKQQLIAKSATVSDQQVKRQRQSQKRSASIQQKFDGLQRQIERLRTKTVKDQQTIEEFKKKLEQINQQLQVVSSLEAQCQKQSDKFQNEKAYMKSTILSLQKQIKDSQKLSQDKINMLQTFYKEERAKLMQKQSSKEEIKQYDQKIQVLLRQNQSLKAKCKSQQIQNSQMTNLKNQLAKIVEECNKAKRIVHEMKVEKLNMQRQYSNLQTSVQSITSQNKQLANRLKIVDEQVKFNQKNTLDTRRTQQLSSNSETVKKAELKNQKLSVQIKALKRQNDELQQKLIEAQRQLNDRKPSDGLKQTERKMSWNESQNLMKGYEDMIQSLRQEKELLEQQINGLKAKVKRLQGNNKIPKSYISPPKSTILVQKSPEKINKQEQLQKNREQTYNLISKSSYFGVNCVLDNQENGQKFLINKIQQIFAGKKFIESKLVYKYTQANKIFAFGSLLPKTELQSESFVFLLASKADIFGVISYKKDSISKQAALIFSINNQRTVTKRPTGDSVTASAVTVEFNGDLNIGNGHLKIKSSNRFLAVKEVLGKYFEQYQKKQIFGKDNWRDEMAIELTELQIHRIYMK